MRRAAEFSQRQEDIHPEGYCWLKWILSDSNNWSGREDLNLRHPAPKFWSAIWEIFLPKELIQRKRYGATAIAPSGLMVFTGDRFSQWHGDIFVGWLRSQDVRRIDLEDAGRVMAQTALRIGH